MKHVAVISILALMILAVGCAEKQQVKVTFVSRPPGGTLYKQSGELLGPCPKVVTYGYDEEAVERGYREKQKGYARITEVQCNGCGQCACVCKFDAITLKEEA